MIPCTRKIGCLSVERVSRNTRLKFKVHQRGIDPGPSIVGSKLCEFPGFFTVSAARLKTVV